MRPILTRGQRRRRSESPSPLAISSKPFRDQRRAGGSEAHRVPVQGGIGEVEDHVARVARIERLQVVVEPALTDLRHPEVGRGDRRVRRDRAHGRPQRVEIREFHGVEP